MLLLLPLFLACSGENDTQDTQATPADSGAQDTAQAVPRDPRFEDLAELLKDELAKNEALAVSVAVSLTVLACSVEVVAWALPVPVPVAFDSTSADAEYVKASG